MAQDLQIMTAHCASLFLDPRLLHEVATDLVTRERLARGPPVGAGTSPEMVQS